MKHLILVRHAKSSWKNPGMEDHDRPLSKRGKRDAPFMAKIFRDKKITPDLLASSTAVRAVAIAEEFADKLDYKKSKIRKNSELYLSETDNLLQYVQSLDNEDKTVMIFGHNPGITWFANYLTDGSIDNVPTSGIVAIDFDVKKWKEVSAGSGKLIFFEYPKLYFKDAED